MAKTTNCAFCGKELTKGFFTGDVTTLDVGLMQNIECCEECCEKYKKIAKHVKKRFGVKCETLKKKTKKKKEPVLGFFTSIFFFFSFLNPIL